LNQSWARGPVDAFILARLEREGLTPSPEAPGTTLIRRVTLDLTGLPPTPAEVDAFLADDSPGAYERVVDRLLASPRFGERMAIRWLDAARYADTNGYQNDGERTMWRWRDWVLDAFNRNVPFDRFTLEQLAGDLLPGATLEQKLATGFNRNHRGNGEGGVIPEEYAVEYVVDRVDTTATVWLGLTMGCARCHDHKYDPLTQKDFYQVFAFFNNIPERGKAVKYGNSPPLIPTPTARQEQQLQALERELAAAEREFAGLEPEIGTAQAAWEKACQGIQRLDWSITDGLTLHYRLDGETADACAPSRAGTFRDGDPAFGPGRIGRAGCFEGRRFVDAGDVANFGFYDKFSLGAWIYPQDEVGGAILSRMTDEPEAEGYCVSVTGGKVHVALVKRWLDDAIRVETECGLPPGRWHHVLVTYDGSRVANGVKVYVDGQPARLKVLLDDLNQSFQSREPLRIGAGNGPQGRFRGRIHDVRVYNSVLSAAEAEVLVTTDPIPDVAAKPTAARTRAEARKLRLAFLEKDAPEIHRQAHRRVLALRRQRARLVESFPTTMIMAEMAMPRDTFVLLRGQYDKPGEKVTAAVPAGLGALPPGVKNDRLGFARWLVDPANPLTARVAVNRYWQILFDTGLVKTLEDFGTQGEPPRHAELLDWLATEFVRTGWDVKALLRTLVTSATYRQSSRVTPAHLRKDPENRLLARGPRSRLPAEMVRDQALAVSGLLVEQLGGPSVRPYQPPGLWKELTGTEDYVQDHGQKLYRRSLYTFWKRTVPPPQMITFDAAGRETCVVRGTRTNTPLQALTLMNDATYVEAARLLAQRVLTEAGPSAEDRLTSAFRLATARRPGPTELNILLEGLRAHLEAYGRDRQAARDLLRVGELRPDERLDVRELAAYTAVAGLLLNLDEVITKE
jgi:hypothetical protein